MNKSVTSGQVTVKRDLVVAPGRRGEAVCPLKALLQSQQPHANSLSLVCRRLCSACQTACSSTQSMLQAETPWCTLVSSAHQIACLFFKSTYTEWSAYKSVAKVNFWEFSSSGSSSSTSTSSWNLYPEINVYRLVERNNNQFRSSPLTCECVEVQFL